RQQRQLFRGGPGRAGVQDEHLVIRQFRIAQPRYQLLAGDGGSVAQRVGSIHVHAARIFSEEVIRATVVGGRGGVAGEVDEQESLAARLRGHTFERGADVVLGGERARILLVRRQNADVYIRFAA